MQSTLALTRGIRSDFCGLCFSDNQQCPTEILVRLVDAPPVQAHTITIENAWITCKHTLALSFKANPRLVNDESPECSTNCGCPSQLEFSMAEKTESRTPKFINDISVQVYPMHGILYAWERACRY